MKLKILLIILVLLIEPKINANNIDVASFSELIQSGTQSINGDTITITDDLFSDESIGNSFYTKYVTFQGQNFGINGENNYGGFVLSAGSDFNNLRIIDCKGQVYNNSYFAGAIYNTSGTTNLYNTAFSGNFAANPQGQNFGIAGALYNINNGTVNISTSLFNNNYAFGASAEGGALANSNGLNTINITKSVFDNNYTTGTAVSNGGAILNGTDATLNIDNSLFNNNYASENDNGVFLYGGSIYNTGNANIENTYFTNNHIIGNNSSIACGGAIANGANLKILNTTFYNNYINSDAYAIGGALFNLAGSNTTIENSTFENNYITSQSGNGAAIGNQGILTIINSTFKNNTDIFGKNDIYTVHTINFNGNGTNNILSGISGSGEIYKNDDGILNLGGNNSNYKGNFTLNDGTVNLLADSSFFDLKMATFNNDTTLSLQNGQVNDLNLGIVTLSGTVNVLPDVDFNTNTMDTINATHFTGAGEIYIPKLSLIGTPKSSFIEIPFANSFLKNSVKYTTQNIQTPLFNYLSSYNSQNGYFDFVKQGFNSGIFAPMVAQQLSGYLAQVDNFMDIFSNLDMVMIVEKEKEIALKNANKLAYNGQNQFLYSPLAIPEQKEGIWFKPYTTFEKVPLRGGPDVSNVSYGTLIGGESKLLNLKKGWRYLYGGYFGYNGAHQAYDGVGIYNNGGFLGLDGALYKNNFFSLWALSVGASSAKANTYFGNDDFTMFNTGIAQKTGVNIPFLENKLIIQPSIMTSYSFVKTFDYTNSSDIKISSDPLNAIHIEPQIKLIGNFKNLLQPYLSVSVAWNILDDTKFQANDVILPELSIKPYVRYGIGIQKRIKDKFSGFFQVYFLNGGRNGVGLQAGLRWALGKDGVKPRSISEKLPELPKTEIDIHNVNYQKLWC